MKIKLGLFGGSGKMGIAVEQMLLSYKGKNEIVPFLFIGKGASSAFSIDANNINNVEDEVLNDVDVWIEFTSPEGLSELLKATEKHKTAIVSGSTGLSEKDFSNLKKQSLKRKIFWASNMSLGLWAFRQAMKGLKSISNFDFALEEIHHTQKKDKPSGTVKTLHKDLEKIVSKKIETPTSFRLGGVFGVHTLYAASSNEVITMQHQALNRTVFAEGSLMAADWLTSQKAGYYSMDDMLLKK
jgi:4-hydroxy-tetrahydrodipicolinate reductase